MSGIRVERDTSGARPVYVVTNDGRTEGRYATKRQAEDRAATLKMLADQSARLRSSVTGREARQ